MKTKQIIVCGFLAVILALAFTACDNDTNGGGNTEYWKITWNLDGGSFASGSNHPEQIEKGAVLAKPSPDPTKDGNTFDGWYANSGLTQEYNFASPVTADLNLYAKWDQLPVDITVTVGSTLAEKLQWVKDNAQNNATYFIEVNDDESIPSQTLSYTNKNGITIHLEGIDGEKVVSRSSGGTIFSVGSGVTLILDNNITLQGQGSNGNSGSLVSVGSNGVFEMKTGVKISSGRGSNGGGVYVSGTFTMNGGEISDNSATTGGGVYVSANGTFTVNDGKISGNKCTDRDSSGGGVYVGGTFTMNGGEISDNTIDSGYYVGGSGGGVYVSGIFTMNNGKISGNTAVDDKGGGVYVSGTFTMNGGEISDNTATDTNGRGGGVYVSGTFTMNSGEISGNSSSNSGGGVYVNSGGIFTMNGGEISGNKANSAGGGVSVDGTFRIVTGTVYGSDAEEGLKNTTSSSSNSAALYKNGTAQYGTFNGETWTSAGTLSTTNNTIKVVNGVLEQ